MLLALELDAAYPIDFKVGDVQATFQLPLSDLGAKIVEDAGLRVVTGILEDAQEREREVLPIEPLDDQAGYSRRGR